MTQLPDNFKVVLNFFFRVYNRGHYITNPNNALLNPENPSFTIGLYCLIPQKYVIQWKIHHLKMYFLLNIGIFQCHVSFQGNKFGGI